MKIPGWLYIAIGVFVSLFSGYIYKFVLKPDGTQNMSMAVFFFVGIVFIIVGFIKLFFKKLDYEQEAKFQKDTEELKRKIQPAHQVHQTMHHNRVEEQVNSEYQKQQSQHHMTQHESHTSQYAHTHPYHGIHSGDTQAHQAMQMSITVCKRCGLKNPVSTNYCHGCGNRLK